MKGSGKVLARRVEVLGRAADAAAGRSDAEVVAAAQAVVRRAGERLGFSGEYTVVVLAGATGSGKSSLFNAITGTQLAEATPRRPTTHRAMGAAWGSELPHELLEWLDVHRWHLIGPDERFARLVLIDVPDHDSTELGHRMAVDRLVQLVDGVIWVVDPQKYADAALHDNYLRPLAPYDGLMMVVLNQVDRLTPDQAEMCVADLRQLLDQEGLLRVPIMVTSAQQGTGIADLQATLARTVSEKIATVRRLEADVDLVARRLEADLGNGRAAEIDSSVTDSLTAELSDAAGLPAELVWFHRTWRRSGLVVTGWPLVSWIGRLRADPPRRPRLELGPEPDRPGSPDRASASHAGRTLLQRALESVAETAGAGLPSGWVQAVLQAACSNRERLPGLLDRAIDDSEPIARRGAWWWRLFRILQWVFLSAAIGGGLWLLYGLLRPELQLPALPELAWYQVPLQWWAIGGGVVGGWVLGLISWGLVAIGVRWRTRAIEQSARSAIAAVAAEQVVKPVGAELYRYGIALRWTRLARIGLRV